jgi:acyl carrier protein
MVHCNGDIKKFIQEKIVNGQKNVDLEKSTNLIEEGIIDSLGIMKLLTFIEESYDIQISDEELLPENFESLAAIITMVESKLRAA